MNKIGHSHRRRRMTFAAIAGVVVAATLSTASCSADSQLPTLTQVDATARLEAHFADAQKALNGQATIKNDDRFPPYQPIPCDDNDLRHDSPVNVSRQYLIVVAVPEEQVIGTLHQYWLGHGWKDNDHAESIPVGVTSPDGYRFFIDRDDTGLTISGETPCATRTP